VSWHNPDLQHPLKLGLLTSALPTLRAECRVTAETGIRAFFSDPYSPWQRGGIENANGLLRRDVPRKILPMRNNIIGLIFHSAAIVLDFIDTSTI
jgi:hypothetical protein